MRISRSFALATLCTLVGCTGAEHTDEIDPPDTDTDDTPECRAGPGQPSLQDWSNCEPQTEEKFAWAVWPTCIANTWTGRVESAGMSTLIPSLLVLDVSTQDVEGHGLTGEDTSFWSAYDVSLTYTAGEPESGRTTNFACAEQGNLLWAWILYDATNGQYVDCAASRDPSPYAGQFEELAHCEGS